MRIQHNIMAMNAYRNYNNNTSALSSNLEKLSSGYKINRAGDDAAGLAISEKMRAQITGLEAAQKNVKDGISLVKTAEGAMQEIQDMLNRMDYLATQSANGTYQDEVDREALQKEVNQLNDEINRIAESANFNGIKLLNGQWDTDALENAKKAAAEAAKPVTVDGIYGDPMSADQIKNLMLPLGGDGPNSGSDVGDKTVLETETVEFQKPSFQVSLDGVSHVIKDITDGTDKITLTVGGTDIEISDQDIAALFTDKKNGDAVTSEELAQVFAKKIETTGANGGTPTAGQFEADDDADSVVWNVRADGKNLVFEFDIDNNSTPTEAQNKHFDTTIDSAITGTIPAVADVFTTGTLTQTGTTGGADTTVTVAYVDKDGNEQTKDVTFQTGTGAANSATALIAAINADDDLKNLFTAGGDNTGVTLTSKVAGDTVKVTGLTVKTAGSDAVSVVAGKQTTAGANAINVGTNGYVNAGTEVVIPGVPAESDQLASTTLDFSNMDITDGMKIKLGDEEYTFAVGADSKFKGAENVVDLTAYEAADLKVGGDDDARAAAFSKLTEAAKDNKTFSVSHEGDDETIGLKQLSTAKDATDMTTLDGFASYISISTIDEKATADAQKIADAEQAAKLAEANAKVAELEEDPAKALNLQIGDTGDDYNQLGVKIGSMKTTALGVDGLSISTAEDAKAAIDTIKNAINYVSSVRGDLGAYQNRLEHTANNLSVMAENITDAESTIRDTDVAEEMMSYVKNNILVQSAQAMLAQANQVPQGVLQLLG